MEEFLDKVPSGVKSFAVLAVLSAILSSAADKTINQKRQMEICASFKENTQAAMVDDYKEAIRTLRAQTPRVSVTAEMYQDGGNSKTLERTLLDSAAQAARLHVYYNINSSDLDPSASTIWRMVGLGSAGSKNCYSTLISEPISVEYGDVEFKAGF